MRTLKSILAISLLTCAFTACGEVAPTTAEQSSALVPSSPPFTCGEPSTTTIDKSGTYNYTWPMDNEPWYVTNYHGTMTIASSPDGHVYGTINPPVEWANDPEGGKAVPPMTWDWKVFGTQNGNNLFLTAPPNPFCCDDVAFFELTDQGGGTLSGHWYSGYDHNEQNSSFRFTMQQTSGNPVPLPHGGTPHTCPQPVAIPFDGQWTFTWNTNGYDHTCQQGGFNGSSPTYMPCLTSGSTFRLYSEYNDGYLQGSMDDSEHGLVFGIQNGNTLQMMWYPMTYKNSPPWFWEGAYSDQGGNAFVGREYFGAAHTQMFDANGVPISFSMTRTIGVN